MKNSITLFIISLLTARLSYAQKSEALPYCDCNDQIEQTEPIYSGLFNRTCKGKVIETGKFVNGNKDGEWITYNEKGTIIRKINYTDGKLDGKSLAYFFDGKPKLDATFKNGNKVGKWTYFTKNSKVFMEGEYADNKPLGVWTVYDEKGNKPRIKYDFTAGNYLLEGNLSLHNDRDILRSDNIGEYYILYKPKTVEKSKTAPLGGFGLSTDMFIDYVEVPQNYWDTYISYEYSAKFNISADNRSEFTLTREEKYNSDYHAQYPFVINTNRDAKIKRVDHSKFSRRMLDEKIREAINLLPPWIFRDNADVNINVSYVINRIIDLSKPTERKYD